MRDLLLVLKKKKLHRHSQIKKKQIPYNASFWSGASVLYQRNKTLLQESL